MFICPFASRHNNLFRVPASYIRILHASPGSPAVDIYINNNPTISGLAYKGFTDYMPIPSGSYNIKVYAAGSQGRPIINTNLFIPDGIIYTLAIIGTLPNISLLPIEDTRRPIIQGKTLLRFSHLSPDAPKVDVTLPDGTALFKNVEYKQITRYIPVNPGKYRVNLRIAGTNDIVLDVPNINLYPDRFYTIYAIGLTDKNPPLQVLIPLDGNSYLYS
ncbi:DUF4397 domain-containing protein [Clostridiaceae bacterium UIB06]|uniref:DUF4397 domain-containing protein n=1 Tax=Clostridium thailandense TaxID=2794346 RepID=A0A949X4M8_9CLOT|nr:DUF4397 domain-containing protein [Clostridium thailandense]MBV7276799.1 DUF4397 domain-containing protein [Clostridium thailandense]MCH5136619.1 DUF4397 domain-containing protein [Clostridiaceae bacterium UIB06]